MLFNLNTIKEKAISNSDKVDLVGFEEVLKQED
jgi:hypothetical protein